MSYEFRNQLNRLGGELAEFVRQHTFDSLVNSEDSEGSEFAAGPLDNEVKDPLQHLVVDIWTRLQTQCKMEVLWTLITEKYTFL